MKRGLLLVLLLLFVLLVGCVPKEAAQEISKDQAETIAKQFIEDSVKADITGDKNFAGVTNSTRLGDYWKVDLVSISEDSSRVILFTLEVNAKTGKPKYIMRNGERVPVEEVVSK